MKEEGPGGGAARFLRLTYYQSAVAVREAVSELLAHHRLDDLAGTVTVFHHGRLRIRLP